MTPIVITMPMFADPIAQILVGLIAGIAGFRLIARLIDFLPFT